MKCSEKGTHRIAWENSRKFGGGDCGDGWGGSHVLPPYI